MSHSDVSCRQVVVGGCMRSSSCPTSMITVGYAVQVSPLTTTSVENILTFKGMLRLVTPTRSNWLRVSKFIYVNRGKNHYCVVSTTSNRNSSSTAFVEVCNDRENNTT